MCQLEVLVCHIEYGRQLAAFMLPVVIIYEVLAWTQGLCESRNRP